MSVEIRKVLSHDLTNILYIYCIDSSVDILPMVSCPCLSVKARLCHVSSVEDMTKRFLVYLLDSALDWLNKDTVKPPLLVTVSSSSNIQWTEEGRGVMEAVVIGSVEIVPSSAGPFISATTSHVSDVPVLPVVDERGSCNCFVEGSRLLVNFADARKEPENEQNMGDRSTDDSDDDTSEDMDDATEDENECDTEDRYHSITVRCAGSAFDRFQPVLSDLRSLGSEMNNVSVSVEPEPNNIKDKNALLVKAYFKDDHHHIGYIPVGDLPRIHSVVSNDKLTKISMDKVVGKYQPAAGKLIWTAYISLLKIGKWPSRKDNFTYNQPLN